MLRVYQDKFVHVHGTGNCHNACIASLMELPLREVANILPTDPGDWFGRWTVWLATKGYKLDPYPAGDVDDEIPQGYSIASVYTERRFPEGHQYAGRNISHSVIMFGSELFHDPYPGGSVIHRINRYDVLTRFTDEDRDNHRYKMRKGLCIHGYKSLCEIC